MFMLDGVKTLWQSTSPFVKQGWRTKLPKPRSSRDFTMTPELYRLLLDVSWDAAAADRIASRMSQMPQRRQHFLAVWMPLMIGIIGYFLIALVGSLVLQSMLPGRWASLGSLIAVVPALLWLMIPLLRYRRFDSMLADMHVVNRLVRVIEAVDALLLDSTNNDLRRNAVWQIQNASGYFRYSYPVFGKLPRKSRKNQRRSSRQCSKVLASYSAAALHGDQNAIFSLRDDYARAILRVGSGHWTQVASLNPSIAGPTNFVALLPTLRGSMISWIALAASATAVIKTIFGMWPSNSP